MTVVALTGRKTAGKDTAAQALIENYGYKRLAFADAIKDIIRTLDPILDFEDRDNSCWDADCCGGPNPDIHPVRLSDLIDRGMTEEQIKKDHPEYRKLAKLLGTEGVRKYAPDFWVDVVVKQIIDAPTQNWVLTDSRFPNEALAVRALRSAGIDSHVIYIQSDRAEAVEPDHESERWAGNLGEDFTIPNNGTVEELHAAVNELANSFSSGAATLSAKEWDEVWNIECPLRNKDIYTPEAHEFLRQIGKAA